MDFKLISDFQPTGDQPEAIKKLFQGYQNNQKHQVLLGVTGSGKTFTLANVIEKIQKPVLVISHNKTLAAQLYQEFRDFFPENAVSYFVSYYDYYQPEAYIPQSDTYIEKETAINAEIDKLRLQTTANLLTRKDVIVVASVSCIYGLGNPAEYGKFILEIKSESHPGREEILKCLVELQYDRTEYGFHRGTFRVRGETIEIFPSYEDFSYKIETFEEKVVKITKTEPLTGRKIAEQKTLAVFPAKHYMTDPASYRSVFSQIREDLTGREAELKKEGKILEAHRLRQKVEYDLEMIQELGYVNGIENYSRYFDNRRPGEPPFSLLDFFAANSNEWLTIIDESHITIPQIRGMYHGDRSRKKVLIDYGFRLPAALDNRPLKFEEFLGRTHRIIYNSATPADWEISLSGQQNVVQQLIRPTGIIDPKIEIRPTQNQIPDLIKEIKTRVEKNQRVLVTTLTKKTAEELADYLNQGKDGAGETSTYLHSEVETLERTTILEDLRTGRYNVVIGINLLREGLDLPEVSLVVILDADKEGFLRSETSLIQTMGRAARHIDGAVIMYADKITGSMEKAINEVKRRRNIQLSYNKKHRLTPTSVVKPIRKRLIDEEIEKLNKDHQKKLKILGWKGLNFDLDLPDTSQMLAEDKTLWLKNLNKLMKDAAKDLDFERAALIRDKIKLITQYG